MNVDAATLHGSYLSVPTRLRAAIVGSYVQLAGANLPGPRLCEGRDGQMKGYILFAATCILLYLSRFQEGHRVAHVSVK